MLFLGIDLGLSGGIAVITEQSKALLVASMPIRRDSHGKLDVDVKELDRLLTPYTSNLTLAVIEWVHSFGNEARNAIFSFGRSTGKVQAFLDLSNIPYEEVLPTAWKKEVLAGTTKDKEVSIGYVMSRWPEVSLKRTPKCVTNSHDLAEAVCLAEYARRRFCKGGEKQSVA